MRFLEKCKINAIRREKIKEVTLINGKNWNAEDYGIYVIHNIEKRKSTSSFANAILKQNAIRKKIILITIQHSLKIYRKPIH